MLFLPLLQFKFTIICNSSPLKNYLVLFEIFWKVYIRNNFSHIELFILLWFNILKKKLGWYFAGVTIEYTDFDIKNQHCHHNLNKHKITTFFNKLKKKINSKSY